MTANFGPQIHVRHWMQQTISRRYHLIWLECDKVVLSIQFVLVHGIFAVNCEIRFLKVSLQLIMTFCIYNRNTSNDPEYLELLCHKQLSLYFWALVEIIINIICTSPSRLTWLTLVVLATFQYICLLVLHGKYILSVYLRVKVE